MSSHEQYNIKILDRILKNIPFTYEGTAFCTSWVKETNNRVVFKVDNVIDVKNKIVIGEWKPVIYVNLIITDVDDDLLKILNQILAVTGDNDFERVFNIVGYGTVNSVRYEISNYLKDRIGFDGIVNVESIKLELDEKENLTEGRMNRL